MSIRVMISPPVLVAPNAYATKAEQYCHGGFVNYFPSNADGTPASTWVLTIGRAPDWTAADADPDVTRIFSHPGDNVPAMKDAFRSSSWGDLSGAERTRLIAVFGAIALPVSDFTAATQRWRIVRRMISWLMGMDENLAAGSNF
jgi:hypothetical protein